MKNISKKDYSFAALLPWLPCTVTFIFLPLLAGYRTYTSALSIFPWSSGNETLADLLLLCKQELFNFLTALFFLVCLWKIYLKRKTGLSEFRTQWHMLIPAGIWLLLSLVSSLCSDYRYSAFHGVDEQFESMFCLMGYALFAVSILLLIDKKEDLQRVLFLTAILSLLLGIIGILQYSGNDPFLWEWVQKLITPEGYYETYGAITPTFEEGRVSLAAYNPNYAGVLLAMLGSMCFGMVVTERNIKPLITEIVLLVLLLTALIGTGSRAGLLVFTAIAFLGILLQSRKLIKHWKIVLPVLLALLLAGGLAVSFSRLPVLENLRQALVFEKMEENPLAEMVTTADGVQFTYNDVTFVVSYEVSGDDFFATAKDSTGIPLTLKASDTELMFYFTDSRLSDVSIRPVMFAETAYGFSIRLNGIDWPFLKISDNYMYVNDYGMPEQLEPVERVGFEGYELFATSRGLIWSTTLPLLKEHLLLGSGANTFVFEYPQNNYKDMYFYIGEPQVMVRPHCMYLQTAVEAGIPALLALLVLFAWYLLQSLKLCIKHTTSENKEAPQNFIGRVVFSCFLAVMSYLVCGLTNDSMISVAPVFWGILGLGLAANRLMIKNKG